MKRTLAAILALSPAMLLAQASVPAQPVSTPTLQSSLVQPAVFAELKSADPAKAAPTPAPSPVRVSTGVTAPALLSSLPTADPNPAALYVNRTVVLEFTVDESGKPTNLKVAQSADRATDQEALTAVSQLHFKPGSLDGQPAAVPVRLNYVVRHQVSF
jgi:TonB family protein